MIAPVSSRNIIVIDDSPEIHADFRAILSPGPAAQRPARVEELRTAVMGAPKAAPAPRHGGGSFVVHTAGQGEEGFRMITAARDRGEPYSVAFIDMRMPPGWDGLRTIREVWDVDKDLQIVVCTAFSDQPWEEIDALADRCDRLLILKKPFDPVEVKRLAATLSAKWRLGRAAASNATELEALIADRANILRAEREQDKMRVHALEEAIRDLTAQLVQVCGGNVASLEPEKKTDRYSLSVPPPFSVG